MRIYFVEGGTQIPPFFKILDEEAALWYAKLLLFKK